MTAHDDRRAAYEERAARLYPDNDTTMSDPKIIRTREELAALDPDTPLVLGTGLFTVAAAARVFVNVQALLPAVVIATGDQVRAARAALDTARTVPGAPLVEKETP